MCVCLCSCGLHLNKPANVAHRAPNKGNERNPIRILDARSSLHIYIYNISIHGLSFVSPDRYAISAGAGRGLRRCTLILSSRDRCEGLWSRLSRYPRGGIDVECAGRLARGPRRQPFVRDIRTHNWNGIHFMINWVFIFLPRENKIRLNIFHPSFVLKIHGAR